MCFSAPRSFGRSVFAWTRTCVQREKARPASESQKKGLRNYWFFEKAHREIGLGLGYRLNAALLPATLVYSVFVAASCWIPAFQAAAAAWSVALAGIQIPAILWGFAWSNQAEFGTFFVLFRRRAHARYFPVCDLLCAVLPIGFAVWNLFFLIDSMGGLPV